MQSQELSTQIGVNIADGDCGMVGSLFCRYLQSQRLSMPSVYPRVINIVDGDCGIAVVAVHAAAYVAAADFVAAVLVY